MGRRKRKVEVQFLALTDRAGAAIGQLENRITGYGRNVTSQGSRASAAFKGMGASALKFGKFAAGAIGTLGVSLTAMGAASVETGKKFESAMARVGALTGATGASFEMLTNQARELGASTVFSANEAAEGMQFLAMAGFSVNEITAAMPGLLAQAAAGQIDLGVAADITSNVLSGFNIAATESGRVADVLTKTSISSNTTIEGLGQTMSFVAPIASNLGVEFEEVAAAAGIMGDSGIQSTRAGTALRGALLQLATPSAKQAALMKELGFSMVDADGKTKSLTQIVAELESKTRKMTDAQRTSTLAQLVGAEAASGFAALISAGSQKLSEFTEELREAGGTAEEVAGKQLNTLEGTLRLLDSALDDLKISLFQTFDKELKQVIQFGIATIQRFKDDLVRLFRFVVVNGGATFRTFQAIFKTVFENFDDILFNVLSGIPQLFVSALKLAADQIELFIAYAMKQFGNLQDLFVGLGNVLIGAFTMDREKFDEGLEQVKDSVIKSADDFLTLGSETGALWGEAFKRAAKAALAGIDTSEIENAVSGFVAFSDVSAGGGGGGGGDPEVQSETEKMERLKALHNDYTMTIEDATKRRLESQERYIKAQERNVAHDAELMKRRIASQEALKAAHASAIAQEIAAVNTSIRSASDIKTAVLASVRRVIQAKLAEAIAKAIAAIPFPANLITGGFAAAGLNALFNRVVPKFNKGVSNFEGGVARVHRDEIVANLAPGTSVLTAVESRNIIEAALSPVQSSTDQAARMESAMRQQTEELGAVLQSALDIIASKPAVVDIARFNDELTTHQRLLKQVGNTVDR